MSEAKVTTPIMFNHLTGPIWHRNNHNFSSSSSAFYPSSFTYTHSEWEFAIQHYLYKLKNSSTLHELFRRKWFWFERNFHSKVTPNRADNDVAKNAETRWKSDTRERRFFILFDGNIDWWCLDSFKKPVSGDSEGTLAFSSLLAGRESRQGIWENLGAFVFIWRPSLQKHEIKMVILQVGTFSESQYLFLRRKSFFRYRKAKGYCSGI